MIKRVYRSMQGKVVDIELLSQKNELTPAIGNIRVNARGDELGPGGKIVRKREEIMAEYYEHNPNAVKEEEFKRAPSKQPSKTSTTSLNVSPDIDHQTTVKRNTTRREVKKNEGPTNS
jgi:hypothetical protein